MASSMLRKYLKYQRVMIGGNGFTGVVKSVSVSSSMGCNEWNCSALQGNQIHKPLTAKRLYSASEACTAAARHYFRAL